MSESDDRPKPAIDASTEHFKLTYFDPPEGLEKYILATFDLQWNEDLIEDRHPGALGQLFFTIKGRGYAKFGDRTDKVDGGPILFNAFEVAAPFHLRGPWRCLGASLSPHGWASLTQAPVNTHGNSFLPASQVLGEDIDRFSDELTERCLAGEISGEQACDEVAEWIRPRLKPVPKSHEDLIDAVLAWLGTSLNPPVEALFYGRDYSRRQIERLVLRYFGFTPSALARKFRAIRAANLLSQPDLTDEAEAEIAEAFFDQSHMAKEIRRFCGYTPSRLGGEGGPMFQRLTHMQNLERLKPFRVVG
ncbi:helix-turn-helix domain-containing protein [uncultured Erythrobacter sp.]|uniref:helix-turn-helix domain-containing protein n=1 Tax=uncultured Erythrobacter sp. TaxID=263913 RepID=UPI002639D436|nr:helix-turn-helix domain-containing protein [uncultured Erythrobacter sp.]